MKARLTKVQKEIVNAMKNQGAVIIRRYPPNKFYGLSCMLNYKCNYERYSDKTIVEDVFPTTRGPAAHIVKEVMLKQLH